MQDADDPSEIPPRRQASSNTILAISTLIAALFVAMQAWYARGAFVEASRTRLLEQKLELCFQSFDAAVALDGELRDLAPGFGIDEVWPPEVTAMDAPKLVEIQERIVPKLNLLHTTISKASVLGSLDRFRSYLLGELDGLSEELLMASPSQLRTEEGREQLDDVLNDLGEFFGAQYPVFEGCRLVAQGEV